MASANGSSMLWPSALIAPPFGREFRCVAILWRFYYFLWGGYQESNSGPSACESRSCAAELHHHAASGFLTGATVENSQERPVLAYAIGARGGNCVRFLSTVKWKTQWFKTKMHTLLKKDEKSLKKKSL